MKKAGRIISLVMILVMLASAFCYAAEGDTFDLIKSNPKDGATGASVENLSVLTEQKNVKCVTLYSLKREITKKEAECREKQTEN